MSKISDIRYYLAKISRKLLNPPAIRNSVIDKTARFDIGCDIINSRIGKYSYCGGFTSLSSVEAGNFTSISGRCSIGGGNHPMNWAAMSTVFQGISIGIMKKRFANHPFETHKLTRIGSDVWIGAGCLIKGGVTIADGAVIGMGAVVTHDVGPYEIWAGNPAHLIRKRFDDETIRKMLAIRWWDWEDAEISRAAGTFNDVEAFLQQYYSGDTGC